MTTQSRPTPPAYGFAVLRTMGTLEALAAGPQCAQDLAIKIAVHPRTARRILWRLVADGYAVQVSDRPARFQANALLRDLGRRLATSQRAPLL